MMIAVILLGAALAAETVTLFVFAGRNAALRSAAARHAEELQRRDENAAAMVKMQKENDAEALRLLAEQDEKRLAQQKQDFEKNQEELAKRWKTELGILREEFQNSAGKMLEERTEKLDAGNHKRMTALFDPFKEKLKELQEQLAVSQKERTTLRTEVQMQLQAVQKNADRMSSEADKLTSALKGTNKVQGNWGELQLEQALVDCGLVKGVNFAVQTAVTNADGSVYTNAKHEHFTPDATVFFPDRRRVFIDSKMSMTAYMRYHESSGDAERADALKKHLESVRSHVKSLGEKKYHEAGNRAIPGSSFEYTIMFMGNEGALTLALSSDADLWEWAFRQNRVIIVSRMSLYPLLWLIRMAWRFDQQSRNQQKILEETGKLLKRLDDFTGDFFRLGDALTAACKTYGATRTRLCESSRSVAKTGQRIAGMMGKEQKKTEIFLERLSQESETAEPEMLPFSMEAGNKESGELL